MSKSISRRLRIAQPLARTYKLLSYPARQQILELLLDEEWHYQKELVGYLTYDQTTVRHHLICLAEAGFVQQVKRGQRRYYRLNCAQLVREGVQVLASARRLTK